MGPQHLSKAIRTRIFLVCATLIVVVLIRQQRLISLSSLHSSSFGNFAILGDIANMGIDYGKLPAGVANIMQSEDDGLHKDNGNLSKISIDQTPDMFSLETPAMSNISGFTMMTFDDNKNSPSADLISTVNLESKITCLEQNCLIQNACFDSGETIKQPLRIRLFGNQTHAQSEWNKMRQGEVIGFRERQVQLCGMQGVNESRIPDAISSKSTATFLIRWVRDNCGHDLGDGAVAAFRLMRLFLHVPNQLDRLIVLGRNDACNRVFTYLAKSVVSVNIQNPLAPADATLECHGRIYFGVRGVSYMVDHGGLWPNRMATLESDLKAFRDMYYRNSRILNKNAESNVSFPERDTIVIMEKRIGSHLSNLGNITEMANFLRQEFHDQIQVVTWSNYPSMKEQLKLLSRTRAMISLPGSDVMNGIFLPDGSALILYCRLVQDGRGGVMFDDSNEMKFWFSRVSYVNASVEPCNSSSVSYNWTNVPFASTTFVNLASLKARLLGLGILPSLST